MERIHRWPSGPEELHDFTDGLITEGNYALVLQMVTPKSAKTPLTTCFWSKWCQSVNPPVCIPGSYRLTFEPRANVNTNKVGYQAKVPLHRAKREPDFVGRGAQDEIWFCLRDLERLYDGCLHRVLNLKAPELLTPPHTSSQIIESLYPETRTIPSLPGVLTLTSPQKHTLQLWIGVHRYILFIDDPVNARLKRLIDEGVFIANAFPKDVFPALTGQALYRNAETRDYRGIASNGKYAELTWSQVKLRSLSEAMTMSDELVESLEKVQVEEEVTDHDTVSDEDEDDFEDDVETVTRASAGAVSRQKRKRSIKLNRLVDEGSSARKRPRRAPPSSSVRTSPSDLQPTPSAALKLKFQPKPPPPRPHKAFSEEETSVRDSSSVLTKPSDPQAAPSAPSKLKFLPKPPPRRSNKGFSEEEALARDSSSVHTKPSNPQPAPSAPLKLKFKPKPPPRRPNKAFCEEETSARNVFETPPESQVREVERVSKGTLSESEPLAGSRDRGKMPAAPVRTTVNAGQAPSSVTPEGASEGQNRDGGGADLEDENEEARRK